MESAILGIHHVTAIASDPQRNLDFYTEVLGLRLVKRTVNFDDPSTYHLYFGDEIGSSGSILFGLQNQPAGARNLDSRSRARYWLQNYRFPVARACAVEAG